MLEKFIKKSYFCKYNVKTLSFSFSFQESFFLVKNIRNKKS